MKKLCLLLMVFIFALPLNAQDTTEPETTPEAETTEADPEPLTLTVFVDSALIRELPTEESEFIGSTFENDVLIAVGRNADGTWFQVRRPFRDTPAGWISRELVAYGFAPGELPITDFTTGVIGEAAVLDSGVAAFVLTEAALRDAPSLNGNRVGVVPIMVTIPIYERSPDNLWFFVNYLGDTGWVAEFLVRPVGDLTAVPISAQFPGTVVDLPIIPPEVQLAQVNRLRGYIIPLRDLADTQANFWSLVISREVVPCAPPAGNFPFYAWTQADLFELPELRRYVTRLETATTDLNDAVAIMQGCGVFTDEQVSSAFANAVNASVIYNAVLNNLDFLEEEVIR